MSWPWRTKKEDEDGSREADEKRTFVEAVIRLHVVSAEIDERMNTLLDDVRKSREPHAER